MADKNALIQWVTTEGMKAESIPHLLDGLAKQLNQQNFEILKSVTIVRTLHPQIVMIRYGWEPLDVDTPKMENIYALGRGRYDFPGSRVSEVTYTYGIETGSRYQESPYKPLDDGAPLISCPISPDMQEFEFSVLADLQAAGATHYLAMSLQSQSAYTGLKNIISWTTRKPGGYNDADIRFFQEIAPIFAICLGMHANHYITQTLLNTYLGQQTGRQVLHGKIRRGDIDTIEAAIWYSDLRGFTNMSENVDSRQLVEWLNEYFETIAHVIAEYEGEILKYIGDAILAIFPIPDTPQRNSVCQKTLAAAKAANSKLQGLNDQRQGKASPPLQHGIALHAGNVEYGNIGATHRLDFTVIGQAVNLAARIEGLCGPQKQPILTSSAFAQCIETEELVLVDTFELKGIKEKQSIFALSATS